MLTLLVYFFEGGGGLHNEILDTYKLQSDLHVTGNRLSEIYILHRFWISLKLGNGVSCTEVRCLWNTVIKTIRVCHRAVVGVNMTPGDLLGRVTSIREHYVTTHTLISNGLLKCLLVSSRHADHSYPNQTQGVPAVPWSPIIPYRTGTKIVPSSAGVSNYRSNLSHSVKSLWSGNNQ